MQPADPDSSAVAHDAAPDADALPRRTTPTWDMELLVSAASVFALFQLAGQIDDWDRWLRPRLGLDWAGFASIMYVYAKGAVVTLAVTFALHLILRARWIALVGMHSVFPGGVRWERFKAGPIQLHVARQRMLPIEVAIERADNVSTIVFSIGVGLAISIVPPALVVSLMYGLASLLGYVLGSHVLDLPTVPLTFAGMMLVLVLPYSLSALVDKYFGARLDPDTGLGRWLARISGMYSVIGMGRGANPLVTVLSSNIGERKATVLITVLLTAILVLASLGSLLDSRGISLSEWRWMPAERTGDSWDVRNVHYADQRRRIASTATTPYVQSLVVRGPWLQLVIPYQATRHNEAIARDCPELSADAAELFADEKTRRRQLLDCVRRLHPVLLSGVALAGIEFSLHSDTDGSRGFLAMIDVRNLAPGRHVIEIGVPSIKRDERNDEPPQPHRIPFWR
jgi:hypothetical protein